jgi:hypothetical protein
MFILIYDEFLILSMRKLFIIFELNISIFFDYGNDGYAMVFFDTKSRGLDRPCLGKMDHTTP